MPLFIKDLLFNKKQRARDKSGTILINEKSLAKYYTIIPLDNRGFCYERKKL